MQTVTVIMIDTPVHASGQSIRVHTYFLIGKRDQECSLVRSTSMMLILFLQVPLRQRRN